MKDNWKKRFGEEFTIFDHIFSDEVVDFIEKELQRARLEGKEEGLKELRRELLMQHGSHEDRISLMSEKLSAIEKELSRVEQQLSKLSKEEK